MSGLADLVCHTDTERSSAPSATTEQILDVATGADGLRRKMCGLYACDSNLGSLDMWSRCVTHCYFDCVLMSNKTDL